MAVSSINTSSQVTTPVNTKEVKAPVKAEETTKASEAAVVYDKGPTDVKSGKTYTPNTELVNKLKADQMERANQLQSLVSKMFEKQGAAYGTANVFTSEFWKNFKDSGMTIDEAAVKQAQEDVSEDGYWGVKQTSERMLDFAKALTGGDPSKIDEMEKAFEKGYKEATKAWGDELPDLSKQTFDAVKKGFQAWREEAATNAEAAIASGNQTSVTTA
jgi:tryptophan 2,3-dioxygenase